MRLLFAIGVDLQAFFLLSGRVLDDWPIIIIKNYYYDKYKNKFFSAKNNSPLFSPSDSEDELFPLGIRFDDAGSLHINIFFCAVYNLLHAFSFVLLARRVLDGWPINYYNKYKNKFLSVENNLPLFFFFDSDDRLFTVGIEFETGASLYFFFFSIGNSMHAFSLLTIVDELLPKFNL